MAVSTQLVKNRSLLVLLFAVFYVRSSLLAREENPGKFGGATAVVFCGAEDPDKHKDFCMMDPPMHPEVFKNTVVIPIPKEKFNGGQFTEFVCSALKSVKQHAPIIPFISGHGLGDVTKGGWQFIFGRDSDRESPSMTASDVTGAFSKCMKENSIHAPLLVNTCHSGACCIDLDASKTKFTGALQGVVSSCGSGQEVLIGALNRLLLLIKKNCTLVDLNHDGVISVQEFVHFRQRANRYCEKEEAFKKDPLSKVPFKDEGTMLPFKTANSISVFCMRADPYGAIPLMVGKSETLPLMTCPKLEKPEDYPEPHRPGEPTPRVLPPGTH